MVFQKISFTVADFDAWKGGYTSHVDARKAAGSMGSKVYVSPGNNKSVTLVFEWADADKMKTFGESDELKEAMKRSGVTGPPDIQVAGSEAELDVSGLDLSFTTKI